MNPLFETYLSCVRKVKIVHSLPGRLRVSIFGVRQNPELAAKYGPSLCRRIASLSGVSQAELSQHTGNLLISYDPKKISEAELLIWLNEAWEKFADILKWVGVNNIQDEDAIAGAVDKALANL